MPGVMRFAKLDCNFRMKRHSLSLVFLFMCLLFAPEVVGKEWRGIVPLHSTRADVIRLFGNCADRDGGCKFRVGNEEAYIVFSKPVVVSEYHECPRKLPPETVLLIQVDSQLQLTSANCESIKRSSERSILRHRPILVTRVTSMRRKAWS